MEEWDIYDKDLNKTGRTCIRGQYELQEDEYHLIVHVWLLTNDGKILLTQRAPHKTKPLKWEGPGGSIIKGESSIDGAQREINEEIGLSIPKEEFKLFRLERREQHKDFAFAYYVIVDESIINEIEFTDGESIDKKWVTIEEYKQLFDKGEIVRTLYYFIDEYNEILDKEKKNDK